MHWNDRKKYVSEKLKETVWPLTNIRHDLDGSRKKSECCDDMKWRNEREGRLRMELGGLIKKAQRLESRIDKM